MMSSNTAEELELSVVVPIWNDREAIAPFLTELRRVLDPICSNYEVIFSIDPSSDGTEEEILALHKNDSRIKGIIMASRAGQPASSLAGILNSKGSAVLVIDVDMQDPVELIPTLLQRWRSGSQLVIPRRTSRSGEPITKKMTAAFGYAFLKKYAHIQIPSNTGDFRIMDRKVADRLKDLPESHIFLRGMVALVGPEPEFIDFERPKRPVGSTKYNKWFGGIRSGLNGIVSFSSALLDFIMIVGVLLALISIGLGLKFAIFKIAGGYVPSGSAQLFVAVTFIGGMQLIAIGVIGLYVGRIFEEVKNRPRWVIDKTIGIKINPGFLDKGPKEIA